MKFLIWCGCIFVFQSFLILMNKGGFYLGGIPTFLYYGAMFYVANKMCKKWGKSRLEVKAAKAGMTPAEYVKKGLPESFRMDIEERIEAGEDLSDYLTLCVKQKFITKEQADVILNDVKSSN